MQGQTTSCYEHSLTLHNASLRYFETSRTNRPTTQCHFRHTAVRTSLFSTRKPFTIQSRWSRGSLSSQLSNQNSSTVSPTLGPGTDSCDRKATPSTVMSHVRSEEVMQELMGATHTGELPRVYRGVKTNR